MKELNNHTFKESIRDSMKSLNLHLDKIDVLDAARIRIEIMKLINSLADTMNLRKGI
jgi:hypothetical protein|tara:strand:- start:101 stop:271 length:171 start_codon:yes stop_codon:yes gene_type:complete